MGCVERTERNKRDLYPSRPNPPRNRRNKVTAEIRCLAGEKKFDEARKEFDAAVTQYPKYPKIHYAYGLFLVEASDLGTGIAQFKDEIVNNPADVLSPANCCGYVQDRLGRRSAIRPASGETRTAAAIRPLFVGGLLLLDTDNFQQAIPELEIARKAFPRQARIYLALGTAYSRAGRIADAGRARATARHLKEAATKSGVETEASDMPALWFATLR